MIACGRDAPERRRAYSWPSPQMRGQAEPFGTRERQRIGRKKPSSL
jgi:hypothetical protein